MIEEEIIKIFKENNYLVTKDSDARLIPKTYFIYKIERENIEISFSKDKHIDNIPRLVFYFYLNEERFDPFVLEFYKPNGFEKIKDELLKRIKLIERENSLNLIV